MSNLRDYFGVWHRCGNTAFWKTVYPARAGMGGIYVDPVDSVLVFAHDYPSVGGPAIRLWRRVPPDAGAEVWGPAVERLPRHMREVYENFMMSLLSGWTVRYWDKERMLRWFLDNYREQGKAYERGEERTDEFLEPAREEVLTAIKKVVGALGDAVSPEVRLILRDELDEALLDWGIMEC
jgi:hypothetical protein